MIKKPLHRGTGKKSFLIIEEEMCIVVALQFLGKCVFPFDRRDALSLVETYLTANKNPQTVSQWKAIYWMYLRVWKMTETWACEKKNQDFDQAQSIRY